MEDRQLSLEIKLSDLDANEWFGAIDDLCEENGFFEQLGRSHCAGFLEAGNDLLVTFENAERVRAHHPDAEPRGYEYVRQEGWSHLALYSFSESWFRDKTIYAFFDRLIDDGFFEDFKNVVFYGGDGGAAYAAAAYSVAASQATVIALRPQATLEPRWTTWDDRYKSARKDSFTDRYGYAPEMIDGAGKVFIVYDPFEPLDACHATLFRKPDVTHIPCPLFGVDLDLALDRMGIQDVIVKLAMDGRLDGQRFRQLLRARRYDLIYVRSLVDHLISANRRASAAAICHYMVVRGQTSYFKQKLSALSEEAA